MGGEQGDVFTALAQRREMDLDGVEAKEQVLAEAPGEVAAYKGGKVGLMGFFVGQVMKKMQGKADAQKTRAMLEEMLK